MAIKNFTLLAGEQWFQNFHYTKHHQPTKRFVSSWPPTQPVDGPSSWPILCINKLTILRSHVLMKTPSCLIIVPMWMSTTQMHTVRLPSHWSWIFYILVALPMISEFHNLSIALKTVLAFPTQSSRCILFSASCGTYLTYQMWELFDFISRTFSDGH